MKKVLFVAYDFPPCKNIGGSLRSEYFVRYLEDYGWSPTVISFGSILPSEKYENVYRVRSMTPLHKPYELTPYGWPLPLFIRAKNILIHDKFDIIYVSCPPFAHTGIMVKLAKLFGIPIILDLRDAWSLDPYIEGSRLKKFIYKHIYPKLEQRAFHHSDHILVNTQTALNAYKKLYPTIQKKFSLLPNGYDEHDFSDLEISSPTPSSPLTILHVGRFAIGNRDPELVLNALNILKEEDTKIIFRTIGGPVEELTLRAAAKGLSGVVQVVPQICHADALKELCRSDVALLYQESSQSTVTAVAGKTHEYIRSGKPIVAIAPPGDNLELIRNMAGFSTIISQPASADVIATEFRRLAEMKKRNELPVYARAEDIYVENFSRRALTKALVEQFEAALEHA